MIANEDMARFLEPTRFIDSDDESVRAFAEQATEGASGDIEKAIRLYYAVRDRIRYDPYSISFSPEDNAASAVLKAGAGFCVAKAVLLAAAARSVGIPSKLGFSDVKNHLSTEKLTESMGTDIFAWHGNTELYLDGKWVKATPAFNIEMCERFGVKPLEFDGLNDSIMHSSNSKNEKHMEYLKDHGSFDDLPFTKIVSVLKEYYPKLSLMFEKRELADKDFSNEKIAGS